MLSVIVAPPRRTTTSALSVPPSAIAAWISFQSLTARPPQEVISSPARSPASAAGDLGSEAAHSDFWVTHGTTFPTVDVALGSPIPHTTIARHTKHRTRFVNGPPNMTMSFFGAESRQNARVSSPGPISEALSRRASSASVSFPRLLSSLRPGLPGGIMPAIFTNPPRGSALIPYSVPPAFFDHRVGPKPMKYWETFTPNFLAGIIWPSSWIPTEISKPNTRKRIPRIDIKLPSSRGRGRGPIGRPQARFRNSARRLLRKPPTHRRRYRRRLGRRSARAGRLRRIPRWRR